MATPPKPHNHPIALAAPLATLEAALTAAPAPAPVGNTAALAFIAKWQGMQASELSTAQSYTLELCELLGVPKPHATPARDYMFERPITFAHSNGTTSPGRVDCYRRGHFVLESKKLKAGTHTKGFDEGLMNAHTQAVAYARALPAAEGRPPFVLVVDVGTVIEVYAEFSRTGGSYTPFPDPSSHRIPLQNLAQPDVLAMLRAIWTEPDTLDPARRSAKVTRQVANLLANLAAALEINTTGSPKATARAPEQAQTPTPHYPPAQVGAYLTRCLFSMFAEDVGLLPEGAFSGLLNRHREQPEVLQNMLAILWADMDRGGFSAAVATKVLHFNGKLFKNHTADGYSLLLAPAHIDLLIQAAQANWREVEPAIFGTLLERALDTTERHALGAHYTPRAYVERLVLPTVVEPLRLEWAHTQAAALVLVRQANELAAGKRDAKMAEARQHVKAFHHRLCTLRVLDPACGSANFLYVTLEHLKRLEREVLNALTALGLTQDQLGFEGETVTPRQLLGIELNPRAAALAELVLWIGWLQWHIRTQGNTAVAEPVVHDYGNIECRDAVLAWDSQAPALDALGQPRSRWDGVTFKTHPVTGERVPDEAAQVPQWRYLGARAADWPQADFIVGNPPFIGNKRMRDTLGDGYAQALRAAWPSVPDSADFVMYWWAKAASAVAGGQCERMGLITSNSLTMIFNRRVVQAALQGAQPVHLAFAVPDHPWVDSANGAAVRIAMTVLAPATGEGQRHTVTAEKTGKHGEVAVELVTQTGLLHADLAVGANVAASSKLTSNERLSVNGMMLAGRGFILTPEDADQLRHGADLHQHLRQIFNGRDLTDTPRNMWVLDFFGFTEDSLRSAFPEAYQWLLERVKPERDQNNRIRLREQWWVFAEPRKTLRAALNGLPRYIATVETAKHRVFQFLSADVLPEHKLVAIALPDAFHLGVLSSEVHVQWALALGGRLGVGNDPVYSKSTCFDTFAFPDEDTGLTPQLREKIAKLAQQIDDHRKRVLRSGESPANKAEKVPLAPSIPALAAINTISTTAPAAAVNATKDLTLTGLYNVREALRTGRALSDKEKTMHAAGLVGVLHSLHTELDAAVLQAYGWKDLTQGMAAAPGTAPHSAAVADLLQRLVTLNTQRALDEAAGHVRWLRPDYQNPPKNVEKPQLKQEQLALDNSALKANLALEKIDKNHSINSADAAAVPASEVAPWVAKPWPAKLPNQLQALIDALAASPEPLTAQQLAQRFHSKKSIAAALPTLLECLQTVGQASPVQIAGSALAWRSKPL